MKTEKKFDCYTCAYRGGVPGSCHSSCNHPSTEKSSAIELMAIFASVHRCPPIMTDSKELNIRGNEHGIRKGWFNWPYNFDPIWLENCEGYKKVKQS